MPSAVSNVLYAELKEIDYTASATKKWRLDERISGLTAQPTPAKPRTAYGPSTEQIKTFYKYLHASRNKACKTVPCVSIQQRICCKETCPGFAKHP